jgi:large subunit ribosomal protein L9
MDVLLKSDVEKLGARGEVVKVSDGYARNYLLPKGLAVKVDKANAYQLEMERRRLAREQARQAVERQAFAERLRSLSLTITATATESGHLYGSVGPEEIVAALNREGVSLNPVAIQLEKPIKELGVYEVPVQVAEDLASTVRVWVVGG